MEEKRILSSCADDIRRELLRDTDAYKRTILIRHIIRLLDYATRFYERQFIVRESADKLLIRQYEILVEQYIGEGKPLTSACCAEQLHLSEAYFNDLLFLQLGHTHNCHIQLKRIETAKEKLRSSGEPLSRIVRELGFPSVQYFCFLFKKTTGISPNEYRSLS
ncbi:MAG: helix-turn-helix transcriptional regulator [Alistipes sp.]|nr:helix-turn-helix transcriptional regulator [Alistipes sp.]